MPILPAGQSSESLLPLSAWFILALVALVCSVGPGFAIIRRLHWRSGETFVASVALSLLLVYTSVFALFIAGAGPGRYWVVTLASALVTLLQSRAILRLFDHREVGTLIFGFLAIFGWSLLLTIAARNYNSGYAKDWLEHMQRSRYFLAELPDTFKFINLYSLPARPPMMNVLTAFAMAQAGERFEVFQLSSVFLNALIFLPCALLARRFVPRRRNSALLAAAGLILNPMFAINVSYPWTKLFPGLYIVLAVHLYWSSLRRGDSKPASVQRIAAFISLSAGLLAHYSAGPYIVALGALYLYTSLRARGARLREFAITAAICAVVIAPWFAWSTLHFGVKTTLASNTTVTDSAHLTPAQNLRKVSWNILDTLIPFAFTPHGRAEFAQSFIQHNPLGTLRDRAFSIYQRNIILAVGATAGPLLLYLAYFDLRRSRDRAFWLWFIPVTVLLGIAVHGERDALGLAGICLQPLIMIGVTYITVRSLSAPVISRALLAAGRAVDLSLGILLHVYLQTLVPNVSFDPQGRFIEHSNNQSLNRRALVNYRDKLRGNFTFLGDHLPSAGSLLVMITAFIAISTALYLMLQTRSVTRPTDESTS